MQKLICTIVTIFSISILFISCKEENNPVVTTSEKQFSADMQSKLEAALDKAMLENHIPGVIVGVWIPGEGNWVTAKGLSNIATDEPMKLENHFRMGSVTKTFTGTVVLKLVEQGKSNLDSSLAYYLPQYNFQKADKITVRYL
ncbi:MAG: serine hydrolase domain-containing protein, partial [Ignavibacteriaceae bacterium]